MYPIIISIINITIFNIIYRKYMSVIEKDRSGTFLLLYYHCFSNLRLSSHIADVKYLLLSLLITEGKEWIIIAIVNARF